MEKSEKPGKISLNRLFYKYLKSIKIATLFNGSSGVLAGGMGRLKALLLVHYKAGEEKRGEQKSIGYGCHGHYS